MDPYVFDDGRMDNPYTEYGKAGERPILIDGVLVMGRQRHGSR